MNFHTNTSGIYEVSLPPCLRRSQTSGISSYYYFYLHGLRHIFSVHVFPATSYTCSLCVMFTQGCWIEIGFYFLFFWWWWWCWGTSESSNNAMQMLISTDLRVHSFCVFGIKYSCKCCRQLILWIIYKGEVALGTDSWKEMLHLKCVWTNEIPLIQTHTNGQNPHHLNR